MRIGIRSSRAGAKLQTVNRLYRGLIYAVFISYIHRVTKVCEKCGQTFATGTNLCFLQIRIREMRASRLFLLFSSSI